MATTAQSLVGRVPFVVNGQPVGWVHQDHLPALVAFNTPLNVSARAVQWQVASVEAASAVLAQLNHHLRQCGLIQAWRHELITLPDPASGHTVAVIERAAARFWGSLTLGVHVNGYVADENGQPTHLWIARRAANKATDPGLLDNLIGGGVGHGQTPLQALLREGFEEAGLSEITLLKAQASGVLRLQRLVPEGLQVEDLHTFDLRLPSGLIPVNQDGEVAYFERMSVASAVRHAGASEMTEDAAKVTLAFAHRHRLMPE